MKILFVAAEVAPFVKTGGLADVAGSLPNALNRLGDDCRVVMPLYGQIRPEFTKKMKQLTSFQISVGWKNAYCGILTMDYRGVTYYFIDNKYYFNRSQIYGEGDDYERFIFFSKAAARLPRVLDWPCNVVHANDWHSALTPVFIDDFRAGDDFYNPIRTLFTIHNLKYQGQYDPGVFYWTNLNSSYFNDYDLKFYDTINFLKGGIVHANRFSTVSESYAQEICYPFFAEGLENVINANAYKLSGIVNGIDYEDWDPANDPAIFQPYDIHSLDQRKQNKLMLQKKYDLPIREDVPLIGMVTRLTSMKGLDLVTAVIDQFLEEHDAEFVLLGTGDYWYEEWFKGLQARHPDQVAARIYYSGEEARMIYSAADLFLMPSVSEPCGLSQMIAMRYGCVPLVRQAGGLADTVIPFNRFDKTGTGFSFQNINAHDMMYTLDYACETYSQHPDDFRLLQENGMRADFSWDQSSEKYQRLYESLWD